MHWSHPEGRDFLRWLMSSPTCGVGYGPDYTPWTAAHGRRRLHVNNGAASARHILAEIGLPDGGVEWKDCGRTADGTMVSRYSLRGNVCLMMRRLRRFGSFDWLASRRQVELHRAWLLEAATAQPGAWSPDGPRVYYAEPVPSAASASAGQEALFSEEGSR